MHEFIEDKLGYRFRNPGLLKQALTHPSARNELGLDDDNQRLEYLGDAALGLAVADQLYRDNPAISEGQLTILRSQLTSAAALAETARELGLGSVMILGRGEDQSGGRDKQNNLADTLEAVIGSAYLDGGLPAVQFIVAHIISPKAPSAESMEDSAGNYKGALQEWAQKNGRPCPTYQISSSTGPAHKKVFVIEAVIDETLRASAEGSSKRSAEQAAAQVLLSKIQATPLDS